MIDLGKFNVLGVAINAIDYEAAVERIMEAAQQRRPLAVSALAVHGVMTGVLDPTHRYRLNQFDVLAPDGQPVRWALRWLHGVRLADRVYGPNLMLEVCRRAAKEQTPIFLFGGTDELLSRLQKNLRTIFPELCIAGSLPSRFRQLTPQEKAEVVTTIRDSGAAITFVGLGCPRQETWVYEFGDDLATPLLAVGAAFNFHAGTLSQAPTLLQKRGLEWLYRLAMEPRRLWRRYVILNPLYLSLVALQRTGLRKFSPHDGQKPTGEMLYG